MTKIKQKIIVSLLIIVLTVSVIFTVNLTTISNASANTGYMDLPQITVFTPGLAGNGAHWSNTGTGDYEFAQDNNSLVHRLSQQADSDNIYRAITRGAQDPSYTLCKKYSGLVIHIARILA